MTCIFVSAITFAQNITLLKQNVTINRHIDGTLLLPEKYKNAPLAILIADSGPTDRDGNQNFMQNNSLKKLAESLTKKGVVTFRYDKRIVKQLKSGNLDASITFDDFITDAVSVLHYFQNKYSFSAIHIIGHSQGSLVGMVAAKEGADGFISIAGAGHTIDDVITEQIDKTAPMFTKDAKRVFDILKEGKTTTDFPPALASVFNSNVQPFMSSWMYYDPKKELAQLNIPILVINGTKDLQVSEEEAISLKSASKHAQMQIIENMNHILVPIEGDDLDNSKSYNESQREISPQLIDTIITFINNSN
jgi:hypothetical protein